jgi:hypothetical protein
MYLVYAVTYSMGTMGYPGVWDQPSDLRTEPRLRLCGAVLLDMSSSRESVQLRSTAYPFYWYLVTYFLTQYQKTACHARGVRVCYRLTPLVYTYAVRTA